MIAHLHLKNNLRFANIDISGIIIRTMNFRRHKSHKNIDPAFQIEDRDAMVDALTKLGNIAVQPTVDKPFEHITLLKDSVPTTAEIEAVRNSGDNATPSPDIE